MLRLFMKTNYWVMFHFLVVLNTDLSITPPSNERRIINLGFINMFFGGNAVLRAKPLTWFLKMFLLIGTEQSKNGQTTLPAKISGTLCRFLQIASLDPVFPTRLC